MEQITVFIPKSEKEKLNSTNHHKKNDWVKLIYYENRKENLVFPDEVVNVYNKCDIYKKNCFYKICSMSNNDDIWDYYRKLKTDVSNKKQIGIKSTPKKTRKKKENIFKILKAPPGESFKLDFS